MDEHHRRTQSAPVVADSNGFSGTGTEEAVAVPAQIGRERVILVDTPGFDDSKRTDTEILTEVSKLLSFQYEIGMKLKGVIYLHRITDVRYHGSSVKTLNICMKICGKGALKNVLLVTTRWNEVEDSVGAARERELREQFWRYMLGYGSTMLRYRGDHDSAVAIVSQLLKKSTIVLDLQRELVDEGKNLRQTAAGAVVNNSIEERFEEQRRELEVLRQSLLDMDREMRRRLQEDWDAQAQRRREEQQGLQRYVGDEVRDEVRQHTQKKSRLGKFLPLLPTVIELLGLFVGIPPGSFSVFTSWFANTMG